MQIASPCQTHLKLLFTLLIFISLKSYSQQIPLANGFAHNDYWHKRPLFDALDNGFAHIETDIYLRHGRLIVAHMLPALHPNRNLEDLYFKPLKERITGPDKKLSYPVTLMIDIKSGAEDTYRELEVLLKKYKGIISSYENHRFIPRQLTIVLTGHKPEKTLKAQASRLAFMDEDLMKTGKDTLTTNFYQTASCRYSRMLNWDGTGAMPESEKSRLCQYVKKAHQFGKKVRLWASPENKTVWKELLNCGVDLINTDKLVELKDFLMAEKSSYAKVD